MRWRRWPNRPAASDLPEVRATSSASRRNYETISRPPCWRLAGGAYTIPWMSIHKIAVIPGDGIGNEVVPEGLRVLEAAGRKFGLSFEFTHFDWSCERYAKTGQMMPEDGLQQLSRFECVLLGAVGYTGVPDHVSLWGLLIPIRRGFDQYVNLRPVRLFKGVSTPLANRKPGEIDFVVIRENTEGEYSSIGGRLFPDTDQEMA